MSKFTELSLPGVMRFDPPIHRDARGSFVKPFHEEVFAANGAAHTWREAYLSTSVQGVVRGFHFQVPPADHAKLVTCTAGRIFDVVVDLRRSSSAFGRHVVIELDAQVGTTVILPRGVAHGFTPLSAEATMLYLVETVHDPLCDMGIRWDSCGVDWPLSQTPILSPRDAAFPLFDQFESPFP